MKRYTVLVTASEEIEVEANSEEEAMELAAEQTRFDVVDYAEIVEEE